MNEVRLLGVQNLHSLASLATGGSQDYYALLDTPVLGLALRSVLRGALAPCRDEDSVPAPGGPISITMVGRVSRNVDLPSGNHHRE